MTHSWICLINFEQNGNCDQKMLLIKYFYWLYYLFFFYSRATLTNIGPAVLNGGITTTLAFILLAGSRSHVFSSFFKIFFLVVTFGLFHGLVVLPVFLSIFGPHSTILDSTTNSEDQADNENQITKSKSEKYVLPDCNSRPVTNIGSLPGSTDWNFDGICD